MLHLRDRGVRVKEMNLREKARVHFIGIGGSGLSAIARMLAESGYAVSGSDQIVGPLADGLRDAGITVHEGHAPSNIKGVDWVVRSSAVADTNPEVTAAVAAGVPVFRRSDFLGKFMEDRVGIAVAGTHGKTTTTAMIAFMLSELGVDPSFIVGGVLNNLGVNAHAGRGSVFVIEADEYDRMFLGLRPKISVVTNLEHDHPDCYPTIEDMQTAFTAFADLLPPDGTLIGALGDPRVVTLLERARAMGRSTISYGIADLHTPVPLVKALIACTLKVIGGSGTEFTVEGIDSPANKVSVRLKVPGQHNVMNALAALAVAQKLNQPIGKAALALERFTGTGRRFEVKGEAAGIIVIDDYAHHPTEIRATLAAARARYSSRRIWAVWQPHTYSRTRTLFRQFADAFTDADKVLVTEIYAAREAHEEFSSRQVVDSMLHPGVRFSGTLDTTITTLQQELRSGDVLLVLSAGDADRISRDVLAHFRALTAEGARK